MVNPSEFSSKQIGKGSFAHLLEPKNQSGKTTTRECKVCAWQGKMVLFLGLINTCMANQYAPDYTKSGKDKVVQPECFSFFKSLATQYTKLH